MFRLLKKKPFFTKPENDQIVQAIRDAERMTSGEIRVFVENRCRFVDAMDRAEEVFVELNMHNTNARNGVVVYVALKDKQFAILGDMGIHQKVGDNFWKKQVGEMRHAFSQNKYVEGIAHVVKEIGDSLEDYFPYQSDDENELPDDIVFGK